VYGCVGYVENKVSLSASIRFDCMDYSCVRPLRTGELISTSEQPADGPDEDGSIPFTSGNSFLPSPLFFVDFMRVSSLDFRGIFQKILKKAVFSVTSTFLSIFYKRAKYEGHAFL